MILQLITDRQRLSPGADVDTTVAALLEQAGYAVAAGLDMIQLRERDLDGRLLTQLAARLVAMTRGTRTRVLVNDRLDVALAAGAHGVHLRSGSFAAAAVRTMTPPGFLIGRSVHDASEAAQAGPVDYLVAGTVWGTPSKPDGHPLLGTDGLALLVAASSAPVLAVGGVGLARVADVAAAGAAGVAGIGSWMSDGPAGGTIPLADVAEAFRAAFDTANMAKQLPLSNGR